ncbi:MAG: recombinase family protein [Ramlibacter sp.]|nr:recombinase family protein [Ramlibacter sp.]
MSSRVYAYIRTSTIKQGTEGVSLEAQREAITGYARKHDLHVVEWFSETQTAAKRGRPLFSTMMRALKRRKVDGLILHRIDRGSRNLRDWADIADLSDIGLKVHFAHDSLDLGTRGGRLAADVQAVVAADFVRNLREETMKGMLGRLKQGLWPWAAPLGYLDHGKAIPKSIDPVVGPLIRKAFELYASGQHSFHTLRTELFNLGLRTAAGKRLSPNGLTTILNNPFYCGIMKVRKWGELFPAVHEPLIPKTLFDRVQDVLHGRTSHRGLKHDHMYRRDIVCATCKLKLIGETQKGHVYYRCHSKPCARTSLREGLVTAALEQDLLLFLRFIETYAGLIDTLATRLSKEGQDSQTAIQVLRLERQRLDARLSAVTDALIDEVIDREAYTEKKNEIIRSRADIDDMIAQRQPGEVPHAHQALLYLELVKHLRLRAFLENPRFAREICRDVTSNFSADGKSVAMQWHWPFTEVLEHARTMRCDPGKDTHRTLDEWADLLMGKSSDQSLTPRRNVKVPTSPCPAKKRKSRRELLG